MEMDLYRSGDYAENRSLSCVVDSEEQRFSVSTSKVIRR